MPNEGCRMLFLSRLSFLCSIYLSALPWRLLSLDAINLFPTTPPCSLSREPAAHEGPHPVPAAAGNHFGVMLWLVFFGYTFTALVNRSLPALSLSVARC